MKDVFTANLSRMAASRVSIMLPAHDFTNDFWISLASPDTPVLEGLPVQQDRLLVLNFWDTDAEDAEHAPNSTHAKQIAHVIRRARKARANLWVNCEAGISRSGAVVEAAIQAGWRDLEHDWQEERFPNPLLYRLLRNEFPTLKPLEPKPWDRFWGTGNVFNPGKASVHFGK